MIKGLNPKHNRCRKIGKAMIRSLERSLFLQSFFSHNFHVFSDGSGFVFGFGGRKRKILGWSAIYHERSCTNNYNSKKKKRKEKNISLFFVLTLSNHLLEVTMGHRKKIYINKAKNKLHSFFFLIFPHMENIPAKTLLDADSLYCQKL